METLFFGISQKNINLLSAELAMRVVKVNKRKVNLLYSNTRYTDEIFYNVNLTGMKPSLKR